MKLIPISREEFEKLYPNIEYYDKPDTSNPQSMFYKYVPFDEETWQDDKRMMGDL